MPDKLQRTPFLFLEWGSLELVNEAYFQEVSEGRSPLIAARIDRLCRSGGEFAALPQTNPKLKKVAKPTFLTA